jgi:hypothetical protein
VKKLNSNAQNIEQVEKMPAKKQNPYGQLFIGIEGIEKKGAERLVAISEIAVDQNDAI